MISNTVKDVGVTKSEVELPFQGDNHDESEQISETEAGASEFEGMRGLRFCSALMIIFWVVGVCIKHTKEALRLTVVECGVESADITGVVYDECVRQTAIFRAATVVLMILALQLTFCLFGTPSYFWDHWWLLLKFPFFCLATFMLLYRDESYAAGFFDDRVFAWIARFGAFAFIILQAVVFLDWAYQFNESMLQKALDASGGARTAKSMQRTFDGVVGTTGKTSIRLVLLLIFAVINLAGFGIAIGFLYDSYGGEACTENKLVLSVSVVLVAIAAVTQLGSSSGKGSITTTGVMALYIAYTSYCAVSLNPNPDCNVDLKSAGDKFGLGPVVMGLIFSFLSVAYITYFAACKIATIIAAGPVPFTGLIGVIVGYKSSADYGKIGNKVDFEASNLRVLILNLNVIFIFVTCYIAMVMTNWGSIVGFQSVGSATDGLAELASSVGNASVSMYLNAIAGWIAAILYILALCIPSWSDCLPSSVWDLKFKVSN